MSYLIPPWILSTMLDDMRSQKLDTSSNLKKKKKMPAIAHAQHACFFACPYAAPTCRPHSKGPSLSLSPPHPLPACAPTSRELPRQTHSKVSPRHSPSATGPASASTPLENLGSAPPISAARPAGPAPSLAADWSVSRVRSAWSRAPSSRPLPLLRRYVLFCHCHAF